MAIDNFFRSISEEAADEFKSSGPGALVLSTRDQIRNDGLFGRKKTRLYFTNLKSVETRQSEKTMEMMSESYVLPDVELNIDPQSISVKKKVIQNRQLTKGGWIVQFWGHDLTTITVKSVSGYYGVTKGISPDSVGGLIEKGRRASVKDLGGHNDPLKTFEYLKENAYQRRFDRQFPYKGLPIIGMVYDGQLYRGYFESFNYDLNASEPFQIAYNFAFTIIPPENDETIIDFIKDPDLPELGDIPDIARGMAAGTYLNPSGTVQRASAAMVGVVTDATQFGVDKVSKKLGVQSFLDVTPSRVVLY